MTTLPRLGHYVLYELLPKKIIWETLLMQITCQSLLSNWPEALRPVVAIGVSPTLKTGSIGYRCMRHASVLVSLKLSIPIGTAMAKTNDAGAISD
jgi:hypothetical protein